MTAAWRSLITTAPTSTIVSASGTGQPLQLCISASILHLHFYRGWFLVFTLSVAVNCSITIFFACYCIAVEGWRLLYIIGLIEALVFCGLGWLLSGFTVKKYFTSCKNQLEKLEAAKAA